MSEDQNAEVARGSALENQKHTVRETLTCPYCTKKFEKTRQKQVFCSDRCRNGSWRKSHRVTDKEVEKLHVDLRNEIARSVALATRLETALSEIERLKLEIKGEQV